MISCPKQPATLSPFITIMKLIKQDIEITPTQLKELYQYRPTDLKYLLESPKCHQCHIGKAIEIIKIILTQHNTIRLEGTCKNCDGKAYGYSFDTPDSWYKFIAIKLQVEGQGGDHSEYLREQFREEKARKERKRWIVSKASEHPVYYQIHISLEDINPKIWRRLLVLPSTSLKTLHKIIQIAIGWNNYHLHQFIYEDERYGEPWDEDPDGTIDYKHLKLHDFLLFPRETMVYEYDFGDGWKHRITLEDVLFNQERLQSPRCVDGARHCPPEDCGGVAGYAELKRIVKNPRHKDYQETMMWLGGHFDPDSFSIDQINKELLKRCKLRYPIV
jgi:hypothetical protein